VITFPANRQDVAVAVDEHLAASALIETARRVGGASLREVRVFDVYRGDQVGAGRKSIALHLAFQASDRTLTDDEVGALREAIVAALASEHGAELRA
jgi:phenylalanyl-tRNA synthetase beta chain